MIKKILISLLILTGIYFAGASFIPSSISSNASVMINSSDKKIFYYVGVLRNWENWVNLFVVDKDIKIKQEHLNELSFSSEKNGEGKIMVQDRVIGSSIKYQLEMKDMNQTLFGEITIKPVENEQDVFLVEWKETVSVDNLFFRPIAFIFMKTVVSSDFESSLSNLKNIVEQSD